MSESLDADFDALPEASLDAVFEALPEEGLEAPGSDSRLEEAPDDTGATAMPWASSDAEKKSGRHARLRLAFEEGQRHGADRLSEATAIAKQLGVPHRTVLLNLDTFRATAEEAGFDPEAWEKANPLLAKVVLQHPAMGSLVVREKALGPITRALHAATDWLKDVTGHMTAEDIAAQEAWTRQLAENPDVAAKTFDALATDAEARKQTERAQRDAPRRVLEREDAKARVLREDPSVVAGAVRLLARAQETQARLEQSRLRFRLMLAENGLEAAGNAGELRAQLQDAELASVPRAYGDDSGLARDLAVALEGAVSTVDVLKSGFAGAGAAAAAGGAVGAVVGAAAARTPAGALAGAAKGAQLAAGPGARVGAGWATFQLEAGDTYGELERLTTDAGKTLTPAERMGGAVVAGALKTGLELVSLGQQTKVVAGPLAAGVAGRLATDATFRAMAARLGTEWAKSMGAEGVTEAAQDLVDQLTTYLSASLKDEALQAGPAVDVERTLEAGEAGVMGAALLGVGTTAIGAGMASVADNRTATAERQVAPMLELAQQPAVQAAPDVFAQLVKEAGEASGLPVESLHVDAGAILRFFQEQGVEGPQALEAVEQLAGPGARERLLEAAASGGKLEVPLEAALSTWGASEVGKALAAEDTTTAASSLTPRQRKAQAQDIEAQAQAVVAEEQAKVAEEEAVNARVQAFEEQVVAAGQGKAEARAAGALLRAFMATQATDFDTAVTELFPETPVTFAKGDEAAGQGERLGQATPLPADLVAFEQAFGEDDASRRRALYVDDVTGLNTRRAWDETQRTPGTQVGVITVPDVKAINDSEKGGHDVTNRLLTLLGGKVDALAPGRMAARSGTDFLVEVKDQAELDTIAGLLQGEAPAGVKVLGFTGATTDAAYATEKAGTDELRKAGAVLPRGETDFARDKLTDDAFPAVPASRAVPESLAAKEVPRGEAFVRNVLMDRKMPGVRSAAGFKAAGPRKFSASLDMRGLKNINILVEELLKRAGLDITEAQAVGDEVLRRFGAAARRSGGDGVFFAHMSGDEFAAKADTQEELDLFLKKLAYELQFERVPVTIDGVGAYLTPKFRSGVAEGSYGKADQQLNRDKAREPKQPEGLSTLDQLRRAGVLLEGEPGREGGDRLAGDGAASDVRGVAGVAGKEVVRLKQDQTKTDAFRKWFSKSKVVDGSRRPLVVFHATSGSFDTFDTSRGDLGAHFGTVEQATKAAERGRGATPASGPNIMPVHLSLQNPLRLADTGSFHAWAIASQLAKKGIISQEDALRFEAEGWQKQKENNAAARAAIEAAGFDGIVYANTQEGAGRSFIAFHPEQVKSATGNRGTFDPADPNILHQDDGAAPKGYLELPAGRALQATIKAFLNPTADVSTVVHESAHAFLEHLGDLAERPDAPQRTRETWAQLLEALSVDSRQAITREHHELFARSFEAYLLEGKAPSAGLRRAFARFASWLLRIYRAVAGVPGAALSPELRAVFDAMLATEVQLAAVRRAQGPALTAEQLAQKQAERDEQLAAETEEYAEGSFKAQLAAVKDALRAREKWWKDGLAKLEVAFADEYEALPGRRAHQLLEEEELVLDRALVERVIGKARVPGLRTAESGGVRPAQVAELAGFPSANAMLAGLAGLKPKDRWVREQAQAEMRRLHPGILDDVTKFKKLLADGLHSATEARLAREWKGLPKEALQRAAQLLVERREAGKLYPRRALAEQRQAAHAKARAAARGDIAAAGEAAKAELLAHYKHVALLDAERQVEKLEEQAQRLRKKAAVERLGKASPAYRDAVAYLLGAVGLGPETELDAAALGAAVAQLEGDAVTIGDPDWLEPVRAALARGVSYAKLTMAEVRALRDALKMLETGARNRTTVLLDGKRVDFEEVKTQVLEEIRSTLPERGPIVPKYARTLTEKLRSGLNAADGFLITPIEMVRDLVGDRPGSMLERVVAHVLRRGQIQEADLLNERVRPILEAFEEMPKAMRESLHDVVDGAALFPGHLATLAPPRRRYELLMLALNSGSESSLQVVTEGRRISEAQVRAALGLLTEEEVAWVNAVHESLEALREPAFALEERETGVRPKAVEARPMVVANGTLRGGYFPLKAEPEASTVGARQFGEEQLAALFDPTFTRPGTAHGHLRARTGAAYPVTLDPAVIRRHLLQVAHDIAFREGVKSVAKLVMDADVQAALIERLGAERTKEWLPWLKDIASPSMLQSNVFEGLLRAFKRNLSSSALSGLSTAFGNFANLPAAITGTQLKARHLGAALATFGRSPVETRQHALALSGILRAQSNQLVDELHREVGKAMSAKAQQGLQWLQEASFAAMKGVDFIVSTAVWMAAYRQALEDGKAGGPNSEASRWADDLFLRVQPSISPVERSRILRDKGWVGSLAQFYSYLNLVYRTQRRLVMPLLGESFAVAPGMEKAKMAGRVAGGLLAFWVSYQVIGELGMGRGPEEGDKDDEEPENKVLQWRNWFIRKMLIAPLATVPVVPLTSIVEGGILGKKTNIRADPFSSAAVQLGKAGATLVKAMDGEAEPERAATEALRAVGLLTGAPTRLVDTTGRYLWEVTLGEREVQGPADFASGVLYGAKDNQPENLFKAMAE